MIRRLSLCLPVVVGCRVVDAPDNLEDLVVYGFVNFTQEDPEYPASVARELRPLADSLEQELLEGFRVSSLDDDDLAETGVDVEISEGIIGVAARVDMASSLDDIAWVWSYPQMNEVLETTLEFEVEEEFGDRDCFLSHACETYSYDGWRLMDMSLFGTSEQSFHRDYRWTALDDGAEVLTARELVPEPAIMSSDLVRVHQQYGYAMFFADGDGTMRVDTVWIDAEVVDMEVPDTFALDFAVGGMNNTAEDLDAYIAENR